MKKETVKYNSLGFRVFVGTVITAVIVVVGVGLWLAGSPNAERARRFDATRITSLQIITGAIDQYYNTNSTLPIDLDTLAKARETYYVSSIVDPETQDPFEYTILGTNTYTICATFTTDSSETAATSPTPYYTDSGLGGSRFWDHKAEHTCFNITAQKFPK